MDPLLPHASQVRSLPEGSHRVALSYPNVGGPGYRSLSNSVWQFTVTAQQETIVPLEIGGFVGLVTGTVKVNGGPPGNGVYVGFSLQGQTYAMTGLQLPADGVFNVLLPAVYGTVVGRLSRGGSVFEEFVVPVRARASVDMGLVESGHGDATFVMLYKGNDASAVTSAVSRLLYPWADYGAAAWFFCLFG